MKLTDQEVKDVGSKRVATEKGTYKTLIPLGIGVGVAIFIGFIAGAAQTSNGSDVVETLTVMAMSIGIGWTGCLTTALMRKGKKAGEELLKKVHEEEKPDAKS